MANDEFIEQYQQVRVLFSSLPDRAPSPESISKILAFSNSYKEKRHFTFDFDRLVPRFTQWLGTGWNWSPVAVTASLVLAVLYLFSGSSPVTPLMGMAGKAVNQDYFAESVLAPSSSFSARKDFHFQDSPHTTAGMVRNVAVEEKPFGVRPTAGEGSSSLNMLTELYQERQKADKEAEADDFLMRGRRLKALGRIDLALRDFETIFRYYPDYSYLGDVLMYRAQCYAFQGQFDKAIESLNLYIEKEPSKKTLVDPMIKQLKDSKAEALTDYQQ